MPSYDYKCKECKNTLSINCSMSEMQSEIDCPECHKTMKRNFKEQNKSMGVIIPYHMTHHADNDIKFDKSPSGRKHFY